MKKVYVMKVFDYFHLDENNTDFKTEAFSGISVFLALIPTLIVNSVTLSSAGMDSLGVYIATALAAGILTILIGIFSNSPYAMISGIGINVFFVYTAVDVFGDWRFSILSTILVGIVYFIVSFFPSERDLFEGFPETLKQVLVIGIGIFVFEIAMQEIGVIQYNPVDIIIFDIPFEITMIGLNSIYGLFSPVNLILIIATAIIFILMKFEVKTDFIIGILFVYLVTIILELLGFPLTDYSAIPGKIIDFGIISNLNNVFFALPDLSKFYNVNFLVDFINVSILMFLVVFFDILGMTMALAAKTGRDISNLKSFSAVCSLGQVISGILGTSPAIVAVENYVGILNGAKTGLTSVIVGLLFLVSVFFFPLIFTTPSFVITPALFVVAYLMIKDIKNISREISDLIPSVVMFLIIPGTGSITTGLMWGIITYVIVKVIFNKKEDISKITWVLFAVFMGLFVLSLIF